MTGPALVDNAADAKQVKNAERVERSKQRDFDTSLRAVLRTYEGRQVLWALIGVTRCFHTDWTSDPVQLAFNTGRKDVGREFLKTIETLDPDAFLLMQQEHMKREKKHHG